jgi:hypothetical protein
MRNSQLYISSKTMRRLRLAQTLYPTTVPTTENPGIQHQLPAMREVTLDELADMWLNQRIDEECPLVKEMEGELAEVEKTYKKLAKGGAK